MGGCDRVDDGRRDAEAAHLFHGQGGRVGAGIGHMGELGADRKAAVLRVQPDLEAGAPSASVDQTGAQSSTCSRSVEASALAPYQADRAGEYRPGT